MEQGGTRREAIVEAMIHVVGRKGYLATSVADVIAEASASRATFYKHFGDKRECFLVAYDRVSKGLLVAAEAACGEEHRWRDRVTSGLAAVVEQLAANPAAARVAIVEISAVGAEGRGRHSATLGRFACMLEPDRPRRRDDLPPNTALMAIGAVTGLLFDELRGERAPNLPRILPEMEFAMLVPYLGPRSAAELCATTASVSR